MNEQVEQPPQQGADATPAALITDFKRVYLQEYREIKEQAAFADLPSLSPSTAHEMSGVALSGGGIRSASFCLGVLQAFNTADVVRRFSYLSTVSGGGYIGTSLTVSMAHDNVFPFGRTGHDPGETLETGHLRDNSRYLLQDGIRSAISAIAIYLRGIVMNIVIVVPFLVIAAAAFALVRDTRRLDALPYLVSWIPQGAKDTDFPFSILALCALFLLLVIYAVGVSIFPIVKVKKRRALAKIAAYLLVLLCLPLLVEAHFALLRIMFGTTAIAASASGASAESRSMFQDVARIVAYFTPVVLALLPFLRSIAEKALTTATTGVSDFASKWTSRIVLFVVALVVPLMLWLVVLQLAYWAIGVSACPKGATCGPDVLDTWAHAPAIFGQIFGYSDGKPSGEVGIYAALLYAAFGVLSIVLFWPILNVNSNSLHQLYRDRLGRAFLFRRPRPEDRPKKRSLFRRKPDIGEELVGADTVRFSDIGAKKSPYHLINTALNVPGSNFANRRGRNADFFIFSRLFIGSEATGYVDTKTAEDITDGLNIGTAMAISGAAAAPNMGMASMRPLSATIAFLNVRLGRWLRHPADIARIETRSRPLLWWLGKPGPLHLLREAFFKSGTTVADGAIVAGKWAGFIFLTDGGHIENLGVYELLRRRCRIIVAVDGEADPDMTSSSLVQLQRFARIDLGTIITMDWQPIADRTIETSETIKNKKRDPKPGPHVALGHIDYPPAGGGTDRETGVLIYIKASLSGDENDYVTAYKAGHPTFPHESTMEQLFSEEQFECYRALGEHIGRRMISGADKVSVSGPNTQQLLDLAKTMFPNMQA
jgi:hypothetical protein